MRPIKRLEKYEDTVRLLATDVHPDAGNPIFPTMRELLCFAAVLGFENQKRISLKGKVKEIDGRIFENKSAAMDLIYLIALAEKKDTELLLDDNIDQCIVIFEEYAQGGLDILTQWLAEHPEDDHGDYAIMWEMRSNGFLDKPRSVEDAASSVSFSD